MRDIYVVSNEVTADIVLEYWFVQNVVLPGLPIGLEWDVDQHRDSVVVYLDVRIPSHDIVDRLKANNNKVVLLHMGDELMERYDRSLYQKCDLIIRNYYFAPIFDDPEIGAKTLWVPNGFKSGLGPRDPAGVRPASKRRFLASFLGWLDNEGAAGNERFAFRQAVGQCAGDVLLQPSPAFGQGYKLGMYSVAMEYSVFAPCPAGNAIETIRLFEALELGCIPITLQHAFLTSPQAFAGLPAPTLGSWDDLPAFLADYRRRVHDDPTAAMGLQQQCLTWWTNYKHELSARVVARLTQLRLII